jgi:urease subunit gamma/beta
VTLVEFGGTGEIFGLNSLTDGSTRSASRKADALRKAKERGLRGRNRVTSDK